MKLNILCLLFILNSFSIVSQESSLLTLDRIFNSGEFRQERMPPVSWADQGDSYIQYDRRINQLVKYYISTDKEEVFLDSEQLTPRGENQPIRIESFSFSPDQSKILIFNNSQRVWRSNTKGDFWVYDFDAGELRRIGKSFAPSSLMFAKFSGDNKYVAYVHDFNLYLEDFNTGEINQLTFDGNDDIINGTFDWVYEEEFGCRDGFRWNETGEYIAFWQLDASDIGTFYMINNTDSIYSRIIPVQYPKVGQEPSACKVGLVNMKNHKINWIPLPGGNKENYIPRMQWIQDDLLMIQQINRKQNHLKVYTYKPSNEQLKLIYQEMEETWVDISYPDITANGWGMEDWPILNDKRSGLRMTETDGWRHVFKVDLLTGTKIRLTPGDYDVASTYATDDQRLYFSASPYNSTHRYLYSVSLSGQGDTVKITPSKYSGINSYQISPNGKYAIHRYSSSTSVPTVRLVSLPDHKTIKLLVDNSDYEQRISGLQMPSVEFFSVTTGEGVEMDGRMILPPDFDAAKKYPVLFHVYGEPWGQVATDSWFSMWNVMLAQMGYVIIDMDNRGTPCLKGSEWRKSIYRKVGTINSHDQAMAAREVLKWDFTDPERVAVWGWSGGGSMTLNLMYRYPEIYQSGISVAAVANQLNYDNIYQERYMGLPQENMDDFIEGSPITYAKNLQGNLLIIHGTGDDNVHYQSTEQNINELIRHNKQFTMMAYPNRSHGIWEGENTTRHLYTLMTNYLMEHTPPGGRMN